MIILSLGISFYSLLNLFLTKKNVGIWIFPFFWLKNKSIDFLRSFPSKSKIIPDMFSISSLSVMSMKVCCCPQSENCSSVSAVSSSNSSANSNLLVVLVDLFLGFPTPLMSWWSFSEIFYDLGAVSFEFFRVIFE